MSIFLRKINTAIVVSVYTISENAICLESALRRGYRQVLQQGEIEQGFAGHFYLVAAGDDFRGCAGGCADACSDCCSLAAVGYGADDRSEGRSAGGSSGGTGAAGLAAHFIVSGHDGDCLAVDHDPGQLQTELGPA